MIRSETGAAILMASAYSRSLKSQRQQFQLFVAFLLLSSFLFQTSGGQQQQTTRSYELKFQSEVDNSTIVKQETQQQVFKCQIRLAPTLTSLPPVEPEVGKQRKATDSRLKTLILPLTGSNGGHLHPTDETNSNATTSSSSSSRPWPANVSLTVDWFKDGRPLVADQSSGEPVSIVNVELRTGNVNNNQQQQNNKNDKRNNNKNRVEVKNTSNGNQLKLTSRLRINQLKVSDSGHYKCLARASFQMGAPVNLSATIPSDAAASGQLITAAPPSSQVRLIEQRLESNSAILSVVLVSQSPQSSSNLTSSSSSKSNDAQHANQVRDKSHQDRQTKSSTQHQRRQQHDNGTSTGNMRWNYPLSSNVAGAGIGAGAGQSSNVNELDDEDLARQQSSNFISGHSTGAQLTRPTATNDAASTNNNLEDDEEAPFRWKQLFPVDGDDERPFLGSPDNVAADGAPTVNNNIAGEDNVDNNDSLSATMMATQPPSENISPHHNHHHHHHHNRAGRNGLSPNSLAARDRPNGADDKHFDSPSSQVVDRLGGRLAKLVHKIAPELSCYTSMGEHYRGALAQIADGRPCSSWLEIRQHLQLFAASGVGSVSASENAATFIFRAIGGDGGGGFVSETASGNLDDIHHNHCRNPTMDPRGPWCFVQYERELDLGLSTGAARAPILISSGGAGFNGTQLPPRYIQRHCPVGPCSEYLWLYIVAPPLGLLIVLSCLIALVVRYIRRKVSLGHNHCGYSASRRSKTLRCGLRKLLIANGSKFAPRKFTSSYSAGKSSSCGKYLDDDIFEIVDDIDWSDGTNQSLSPKSQESLKLSLAATNGDCDSDRNGGRASGKHRLTGATSNSRIAAQQLGIHQQRAGKFGQVGPVFATLRCQARNNLKSVSQVHGNTLSKLNKSTSTFIEQQRSGNGSKKFSNPSTTSSLSPKSSSLSSPSKDAQYNMSRQEHNSSSFATDSGRLISCSSTTEDIDSSLYYCRGEEKCASACDLPLISADSISMAPNQQQPLYESKFSQIQLAFVKRTKGKDPLRNKSADIGAQVALCSLKSSANSDFESIFEPANLKLRNLNHLNLLKLIGYSTDSRDDIVQLRQAGCCTLVFDMGQLVDLSDWLRQQSKDIMMSCEPSGELGTRRNLTCFAKQVALALDYLHDKGIVYKDLACRNCFLDPTKMLVKLASFNQEFAGSHQSEQTTTTTDEQLNSLRSMIRPKYLLDYYVIDSRPSDSQLLPLSWIPLESILFNKFNMQTDVWSFGCLLYELFSLGEVAYFGYSSKQVIDAVRSNLMPPQPLLCPNGIYKLMCKCLSDIPSMRPNVKQIYEQLNLYSGQCSSFLDHHLCSLTGCATDSDDQQPSANHQLIISTSFKTTNSATPHHTTSSSQGSISKTKSYANIKDYRVCDSNLSGQDRVGSRPEVTKIPLSKSINLTSSRLMTKNNNHAMDTNHYDEPVVDVRE